MIKRQSLVRIILHDSTYSWASITANTDHTEDKTKFTTSTMTGQMRQTKKSLFISLIENN